MISKRISSRKDGKSSSICFALREGLVPDRDNGEFRINRIAPGWELWFGG